MRKPLLILIIAFCVLFALPSAALANAPPPTPYHIDILVIGYPDIDTVNIWGLDQANNYRFIEHDLYPEKTKLPTERIIDFYNEDAEFKSFMLVVKLKSGEELKSNYVDYVEWGTYVYGVNDNVLKQGEITSRKPHGFTLFFGGFMLLFALMFTLFVEWLISLAFKLRPGKYVVYINVLTNLSMNILVLVIYANIVIDYLSIIICLEAAVMAVEYLFYSRKYKDVSKTKLLAFVLIANLASWLLYWLFGGMF